MYNNLVNLNLAESKFYLKELRMNKGTIFLQLLEKSSLTIVLFIIITKIQGFNYIFQKENYKLKDLLAISLIFTVLAILGTYNGIYVQGSQRPGDSGGSGHCHRIQHSPDRQAY